MQKHVNLVDLVKSFPTHIFLQNLASIQKRTSPRKFDHLAEKSDKGSTSNLSTKVRGPAMSIAVLMNFSANLAMTFTLEKTLEVLTPPGVFFMYAGLTLLSFVFVRLACPETKGKTLEEIEAIMSNKKPVSPRTPVVAQTPVAIVR